MTFLNEILIVRLYNGVIGALKRTYDDTSYHAMPAGRFRVTVIRVQRGRVKWDQDQKMRIRQESGHGLMQGLLL